MKSGDIVILGAVGLAAYLLLKKKEDTPTQPGITVNIPDFTGGFQTAFGALENIFGYQQQGFNFAMEQFFKQQTAMREGLEETTKQIIANPQPTIIYMPSFIPGADAVKSLGYIDYQKQGIEYIINQFFGNNDNTPTQLQQYKQMGQYKFYNQPNITKEIMDAQWDASRFNNSSGNYSPEDIQAIGKGVIYKEPNKQGWVSYYASLDDMLAATQATAKPSTLGTLPGDGIPMAHPEWLVTLGTPKGTPAPQYAYGTPNSTVIDASGNTKRYDAQGVLVFDSSGFASASQRAYAAAGLSVEQKRQAEIAWVKSKTG